jgi:nucleoside-diphosphate-sugar epimerase
MRVFLTGGTGAIGRHALTALLMAGHEVSVLVRSEEKAARVTRLGAQPVQVSLFDRAGLETAIRGHEAVVNLATAIPPNSDFMRPMAWEMNDRIRTEGSATLVDAALAAGALRFIQESVVMLYSDGGDVWLDESAPTDDFAMARGNHAAEASAHRFTKAGGTGVVLRFGWFYGPGATHSEEFLDLARRWGVCIQLGRNSTYLSSTHVEDGGRAVAAALGAPSGTYNASDDEPLTKKAYADALAAAAGRKAYVRAPGRLALLLGDKTTSLTRSVRASNLLLKEVTGWAPSYRSAREGWMQTAGIE